MNMLFVLFVFVLFFILTPGVLLTLPRKGSKMMVALVHGLIFTAVLSVSENFFWKYKKNSFEGATTNGLRDKPESVTIYETINSEQSPGQTPGSK